MNRLGLYTLDVNYVAELAKADNKVMSISPQQQKEKRPFVGVVVVYKDKKYCIPLTSPKPKHAKMKNGLDFMKLSDTNGKPLGAMNLNNMIPVDDRLIKKINLIPISTDSPQDVMYKNMLNDQLDWCNNNRKSIIRKAINLYQMITEYQFQLV